MGSVGRLFCLSLGVTGLLGAACFAWMPYSNVSIDPENFVVLGCVIALLIVFYLVAFFVSRRVAGDASTPAAWIRTSAGVLQTIVTISAVLALFMLASCVFMYVASATSRPLVDASLAAFDRSLGLDWVNFVSWLNQSPTLSRVLMAAYNSVLQQLILVLLFLAVYSRAKAVELVSVFCVSLTATDLLMAAFPSAGAYHYYQPAGSVYSHFTGFGGLAHLNDLMALRSGQPFKLVHTIGLVSFPSFHASLGVMIVYAVRRWKWLFFPCLALNTTMLVAALPEGGHHLVDVIAGVAIAIASIIGVRMLAGDTVRIRTMLLHRSSANGA